MRGRRGRGQRERMVDMSEGGEERVRERKREKREGYS